VTAIPLFKHDAGRAAVRHSVAAVLRVALLVLLLLPLAACASDETSGPVEEPEGTSTAQEPRRAPAVITAADSGATISLPVGGETSLRLSSDWVWEEPVVDGDAVQLAVVNYIQDPGFSEWVVMAVGSGEATITLSGTAACAGQDGCADAPQDFQVRITVEA
jgi:predicted secreted protein